MEQRKIDQVSFTKARKAQSTAALASGDISSLVTLISALQVQVSDLINAQAATNTNVTDLTTAYNAHKHGYTDIDNLAVIQNKITSTPQ
jgi:hypothetical protein